MTDFSHLALQRAIYETLTDDTALMTLVAGIYDRPPQGSAFPYVTLGDSAGRDWSTKTTNGMEHTVTLHVWSREAGRKETATIMERIYALLHDANLSVEDHSLVMIRFISSSIALENDGWTYHGIMRFLVILEAQ